MTWENVNDKHLYHSGVGSVGINTMESKIWNDSERQSVYYLAVMVNVTVPFSCSRSFPQSILFAISRDLYFYHPSQLQFVVTQV